MSRFAKFVVIAIAVLAAVFAAAAVAFLLFFNPNDFREDVEKAVKEATGRDLTIAGGVDLQIIPWLAVSISDVTLSNAPGFGDEAFARLDSAELSVKFWPLLLQQTVIVGTAEIDGLVLNLAVNDSNVSNWEDLAATEEGADEEHPVDDATGEATDGTLAVSGVAVRNANISYTAGGSAYSLGEADFEIGGVLGVGGTLTIDDVSLEGIVSGVAEMPSRLSFETAGIVLDMTANVATMQPVEISVLGIDISADIEPLSYAGAVRPKAAIKVDAFSPRSVMTLFGVEPPETADPVALSSVMISANAAMREDDISLTDIDFKVDDTTFTGSLALPLGETSGFRFDLSGDAIDLNRYMAPATEEVVETAGDTVPVEIPADLIRAINAKGGVKIATVMIGRLQLDNVTLGLVSSGGRMRMHPISAELYGGNYQGDVRIDATGPVPVLSVDENINDVDLAELAAAMFEQQNITGMINGRFRLTGRGSDMAAVQRSLGGDMSFELRDGTYEGTDVWYELRRARAMLKQETPPEPTLPARTKFSSVSATGVVTNGLLKNDDFVADLPFMKLTGKGTANIAEGTVDYRMSARIFNKPEAMDAATPEEIEDFTKTVIPLRISGELTSPKVAPDVEEMLRERAEEELRDVVKEKLEDKLKDLFKQ